MEKPYKGRATIQDNFTEVKIIIPAKKNWLLIIFISAWLGIWLMGETFALGEVLKSLAGNPPPPGLFILLWLAGWTAAGFFVFRTLLWNLVGKEIITVGQGRLSIAKSGLLFFKPKVYDLNELRNIRVQEENPVGGTFFGGQRNNLDAFNLSSTIRFDYGLKTVKFAGGIDEAEAKFIVDKLKERNLLTGNNYS
jgi:hypothetical protein